MVNFSLSFAPERGHPALGSLLGPRTEHLDSLDRPPAHPESASPETHGAVAPKQQVAVYRKRWGREYRVGTQQMPAPSLIKHPAELGLCSQMPWEPALITPPSKLHPCLAVGKSSALDATCPLVCEVPESMLCTTVLCSLCQDSAVSAHYSLVDRGVHGAPHVFLHISSHSLTVSLQCYSCSPLQLLTKGCLPVGKRTCLVHSREHLARSRR